MSRIVLLVPAPLDRRSGGSEYDRRIGAGLQAHGWTVDLRVLDASFPRPTDAALRNAADVLASIPDDATVVVDGLAFGAMPTVAERETARLRLIALVHMPLSAEAGITRDEARRFEADERRALAAARAVIVTSDAAVKSVEDLGVHRSRIAIVQPGTDRAPLAKGSAEEGDAVHLLSVAAMTAGKGHEILLRSLQRIREMPWVLTCVGRMDHDANVVARVRDIVRRAEIEDRVRLAGELRDSALATAYDRADVFVHPSTYETFGMVVAEALARGLPVVATATGAVPALVGPDAGLVVPPCDDAALSAAIGRVVADAALRARLAEGARRVRERLPTWDRAAEVMAFALTGFGTDGRVDS